MPEDDGSVDILVLLQAGEQAGLKAQNFLNQLVWGLGAAIENVLAPELLQQVAQGQGSQAEREQVFTSQGAPGCADETAPSLTDKPGTSLTKKRKVTSKGTSVLGYRVEANQSP